MEKQVEGEGEKKRGGGGKKKENGRGLLVCIMRVGEERWSHGWVAIIWGRKGGERRNKIKCGWGVNEG